MRLGIFLKPSFRPQLGMRATSADRVISATLFVDEPGRWKQVLPLNH
jgi:hypothetical protein